ANLTLRITSQTPSIYCMSDTATWTRRRNSFNCTECRQLPPTMWPKLETAATSTLILTLLHCRTNLRRLFAAVWPPQQERVSAGVRKLPEIRHLTCVVRRTLRHATPI